MKARTAQGCHLPVCISLEFHNSAPCPDMVGHGVLYTYDSSSLFDGLHLFGGGRKINKF